MKKLPASMIAVARTLMLALGSQAGEGGSRPPLQEATIVVTSAADSGAGTLREALERAGPETTVTFDPPSSPWTHRPRSS